MIKNIDMTEFKIETMLERFKKYIKSGVELMVNLRLMTPHFMIITEFAS